MRDFFVEMELLLQGKDSQVAMGDFEVLLPFSAGFSTAHRLVVIPFLHLIDQVPPLLPVPS